MHIALIAPPWLPVPSPSYGGVEAVVDRLARGFDAAGHDVLLYTRGESNEDLVEKVHKIPEIPATHAGRLWRQTSPRRGW